MKRVMKTRHFCRWMRKTELSDAVLCQAVAEMEAGLVDADLGGGVVKKRVALPGRGKSGSVRTLLATNKADRWFFVFGMLCGAAAGHAGIRKIVKLCAERCGKKEKTEKSCRKARKENRK